MTEVSTEEPLQTVQRLRREARDAKAESQRQRRLAQHKLQELAAICAKYGIELEVKEGKVGERHSQQTESS